MQYSGVLSSFTLLFDNFGYDQSMWEIISSRIQSMQKWFCQSAFNLHLYADFSLFPHIPCLIFTDLEKSDR